MSELCGLRGDRTLSPLSAAAWMNLKITFLTIVVILADIEWIVSLDVILEVARRVSLAAESTNCRFRI